MCYQKHNVDIQSFHDYIIRAYLDAGYENIPYSDTKSAKVVPGWNEHVEPYKQQALFGTKYGNVIIRPEKGYWLIYII